MILPHVVVGLVVPVVIGGLPLFFTTTWPYLFGCWRSYRAKRAEGSAPVRRLRPAPIARGKDSVDTTPTMPVVKAEVVGNVGNETHETNETNESNAPEVMVIEAQSVTVVKEEKELF